MSSSFPPTSIATSLRSRTASFARQTLDGWADVLTGTHRHVAVLVSLVLYTASWTLYRCVTTYPRNIHTDMSELYAWSLAPAWGYEKHPPLSAFIVHGWFAFFPQDDWAFTLLAAVNVSVSLYLAWLILNRWTDPAKAAFGLALLAVIPFYNFHGLKYNANTVMLPLWAFAAFCFLRAYEDLDDWWSIFAGVATGAAVLGKYWSVFLTAGLILAAVLDVRRVRFFTSRAPYLMLVAGTLTVLPHILWIIDHKDALAYVAARAKSGNSSTLASVKYTFGIIAYASVSLSIWFVLLRPNRTAMRDTFLPSTPQRRLALTAHVLPNALPVALATLTSIELTPLWALPGYSLLPLVLLSSPHIAVSREGLGSALGLASVVTVAALLLSPAIAMGTHVGSNPRSTDYARTLTRDVSARWQDIGTGNVPMIFSCGPDASVAMAVAWDLKIPTRKLFGRQGIGARAELLERGGIIVGASDDAECPEQVAIVALRSRTEILFKTYRPTLFGVSGRSFRYFAAIVPPPSRP